MSGNIEDNKRIAKNSILLYIRMIFTLVISLYMSRVVLEVLGVEDYGIYNVVGGIVGIISFISNSLAASTQRFITYELGLGDNSRLHRIFSTSIVIHLIIALVLFLITEPLGLWLLNCKMNIPYERASTAFWVFQCSVGSMLVMILSIPYNAVIIAHEKMSAFAYISILDVSLKLLSVFLLKLFNCDLLLLYAIFLLVVQIIIRLIYGLYCSSHFDECKPSIKFDASQIKEMLSFSTWALFGNMAVAGYTHGINILLNIFFTPIVNAARGIAVQIQSAISLLVTNFQLSVNPQITKSYATSDFDRLHTLVFASSKFSFYLALFAIIPLYFNLEFLLNVWLHEVPQYTVSFIGLLCFIQLIDTLANPITAAVSATGIIRNYQVVVGIVQLLILPISYVFLYYGFPPQIVYVVHLCIAIVAQISRVHFVAKLLNMSYIGYFKNVILRIVPVFIITWIVVYYSKSINCGRLLFFILSTIITFVTLVISIYFVGLSYSERNFVKQKIKIKKK